MKTGVRAASTGDSVAGPGFPYPKALKLAVAAVVLLPLLFYTVSLVRIMGATLAFPWELDQGEGHNVWSAWLLMRGQGPYLDLNHYPFFDINYPPFHFVMMIPLLWIFGPSLLAGRLLADLCVFGLAAAVGAIVWRYSRRNGFATALGTLLILANPYLYIFGVIATVNVSQVMLGAWGLFCLGLALDKIEADGKVVKAEKIAWKPLVTGLVLLLAAIYTKQQAIDAVGTGFLFFLWRRPKRAIVCGLIFGTVGGGLFLLIDLLTTHQFYINLIKVNINEFIKRQLLDQWTAYGLTHAPLLLLAAGYAWHTVRQKTRLSLWLLYLVITTLGSALVGKFGAAETYFYSSITSVAIAAALFCGDFFRNNFRIAGFGFLTFKKPAQTQAINPSQDPVQPSTGLSRKFNFTGALTTGAVVLLVLQNVIFYHTPETPHPWKDLIKGHSGNYVLFGTFPTEAEKAAGQRIADLVKSSKPPIITEEASFAMVNGYEVVTNPSNILVYNQAGLWQSRELTTMVQNGCFSLIVLHGHFLPDVVQAQIPGKYRQVLTEHLPGGEYDVWQLLPGGRTANPDGCFGH